MHLCRYPKHGLQAALYARVVTQLYETELQGTGPRATLERRGIELDHVDVVSRDGFRHEDQSSVWRSAARELR
jgi:hypothetical protein